MNLGFGIGSLLDGVIYETFGGYGAALIINALLGVAAAVTILLVPYLGRERARTAAGRQLLAEGQAA
jgi:predicted MFS family arabinose efflux permease